MVFGFNLNIDAVDFLDNISDGEWCQIFQAAFPIDLRYRNNQVFSQRSFYEA